MVQQNISDFEIFDPFWGLECQKSAIFAHFQSFFTIFRTFSLPHPFLFVKNILVCIFKLYTVIHVNLCKLSRLFCHFSRFYRGFYAPRPPNLLNFNPILAIFSKKYLYSDFFQHIWLYIPRTGSMSCRLSKKKVGVIELVFELCSKTRLGPKFARN